jgi:hypothetical protein
MTSTPTSPNNHNKQTELDVHKPKPRRKQVLISSDEDTPATPKASPSTLPHRRTRDTPTLHQRRKRGKTTKAKTSADKHQRSTPKRSTRKRSRTGTFTKDDLIGRPALISGTMFGPRYSHKRYKGSVQSYKRGTKGKLKGYDTYFVQIQGDTNVHDFSLSDLLKFGVITEAEHKCLNDKHQF